MRLFVAIRPPEAIRRRLLDLMGGISGARWQDDDQLHLTIRFIGEVDRHQAADIHAALDGVSHPRFVIGLAGVGTFDKRGSPDAVWAGVTPPEPVRTLHNKVDRSLARVGIAPEHRVFHPHVTLARLGRGAGRVHGFLADTIVATPPFEVTRFGLFESRLTPDGAVYAELESYPLARSGPSAIVDISRSTNPA